MELFGRQVHYLKVVSCGLQLVPIGAALGALERDYAAMLEDGLLSLHQPSFDEIMASCLAVKGEVNRQAKLTP